ncbi:SEC14-like protein 2 isoform X2 [Stegodyphus dumicola]|uniref:SEC14-like protein 2 isoform X2 n=1 Tax=Stegodyphus dumicola TaxID=202533 RepID=UPI0015B0840F|nr:SEC14-like protein 2 isoform X2 [Stegodyphus dumicola]XP_035214976.1 SEC14-like protein 2 isoform X2 [Stegodyphus dumicola]XP_035214977.1 SEC14-like protein 2 isoform X2 [Stegodyphus dumicola]XP_035214978.1 SEC14-like protein 2 isoform X2 [Stegodyphus dumicola]
MSGHFGDLSPLQEKALNELKEAVADVHQPHYDDYYYLRWLRAREFNPVKAEAMMRKNLMFRKAIGADTILTDYKPPELIDKYYPRGYIGPDKDGCPVRVMPFTNLDLRGFVYSVQKSEILRFLTYLFEQDIKEMEEMSKKTGKVIEKHSYIVDVDGYTFRQATNRDALNMLNEVLKLYEANYPERMKTTYFINVPTYFNIVLNLSKPFLSEATLKKFRLFGKDYKKALLVDIDADVLPKFFGGNRTDPDGNPRCESIINFGGMIPPECYALQQSVKPLEEEEGVTCIKVPRQSYRFVEIHVPDFNCKVEWIFETPTKDIAIGFYRKRENDSSVTYDELLPMERVFCHLVPESGTFLCDAPGTYALKFDNSYSWMSSKKVFYKIKISSATENDICG